MSLAGVGWWAGPDGGGVVWVHGLATFAGDEAARRLAAVQLVQLKAATQVQVAEAFRGATTLSRSASTAGSPVSPAPTLPRPTAGGRPPDRLAQR